MKSSQELYAEAKALDEQSAELKRQAREARLSELRNQPQIDRMVFASYARCPCGAGMAYDPAGESGASIHGYWDCSAILLGTADPAVKHEAKLPFAFYSVKSEGQPSAGGATTRPATQPAA